MDTVEEHDGPGVGGLEELGVRGSLVNMVINRIMKDGKKSLTYQILYRESREKDSTKRQTETTSQLRPPPTSATALFVRLGAAAAGGRAVG